MQSVPYHHTPCPSCQSVIFSVPIGRFHVPETAPFAGDWRVLVSLVELDVLHRVAQAHPLHAAAPDHIATHLDDRQVVDQLLRIRHMRRRRQLYISKPETSLAIVKSKATNLLDTDRASSLRHRTDTL